MPSPLSSLPRPPADRVTVLPSVFRTWSVPSGPPPNPTAPKVIAAMPRWASAAAARSGTASFLVLAPPPWPTMVTGHPSCGSRPAGREDEVEIHVVDALDGRRAGRRADGRDYARRRLVVRGGVLAERDRCGACGHGLQHANRNRARRERRRCRCLAVEADAGHVGEREDGAVAGRPGID